MALASWKPFYAGADLLGSAQDVEDRYGISTWDALIVAAARRLRCSTLLTEDLQDGKDFYGTVVRSPFTSLPEHP